MTTPTTPTTVSHTWTGPAGQTWDLDHYMLDAHAVGWQWDGRPYTAADGPILRPVPAPCEPSTTGRCRRLAALAAGSGLWQIPLNAPQDLAHLLDPEDTQFRVCAGAAQ